MHRILASLKDLATPKGLLALMLAAVLAFLLFWKPSEVLVLLGKKRMPDTARAKQQVKESAHPLGHFAIERIDLSPAAFRLPAYFLVAVTNDGARSDTLSLWIDFGQARVVDFDVRPSASRVVVDSAVGKSAMRAVFVDVRPRERVYLYALLSSPQVSQIVVQEPQGDPLVITGASLQKSKEPFVQPWMITLKRIAVVMLGFFGLLAGIWIVRGIPYMLSEPSSHPAKPVKTDKPDA